MPNKCDLLAWMAFQIVFGLKDDLLGKSKAEGCIMGFGFVAQIAVFATEVTGVGGFDDDYHKPTVGVFPFSTTHFPGGYSPSFISLFKVSV